MKHARTISSLLALLAISLGTAACGGSSTAAGTMNEPITVGEEPNATVVTVATEGGATEPAGESTAAGESAAAAEGDAAAGKAVFTANCGGCHTLADAGTAGAVGPNLDDLKPDAATVTNIVTNGRGAMPPFKDSLAGADIANVAAYVSSAAGA